MQFGGQPTPWSEVEIDRLRLRSVSQILIDEIGSAGPENAEESARRACGVIQRQADKLARSDARIVELESQVKSLEDHLSALAEVSEDSTIARARAVMNGDDIGEDEDAARAGNGGVG